MKKKGTGRLFGGRGGVFFFFLESQVYFVPVQVLHIAGAFFLGTRNNRGKSI